MARMGYATTVACDVCGKTATHETPQYEGQRWLDKTLFSEGWLSLTEGAWLFFMERNGYREADVCAECARMPFSRIVARLREVFPPAKG